VQQGHAAEGVETTGLYRARDVRCPSAHAMASSWQMGLAEPADGLERIGCWAGVDWVGPLGSAKVE
jgi:hypothetical protein